MTPCFRWWPAVAGLLVVATTAVAEPRYALGLYGPEDVKRGPDAPFPYVNPAAPQGGALVMRSGPFTKLNPYSLKGVPAPLVDLIFESGAKASAADDEPFTVYGHLWESMDLAADRLSMTCRIREHARFSDGQPVTAEDFVFSHQLMKDPEFHPMYRQYFAEIQAVTAVDARTVRFQFARRNQELPLIAGELPVLPKHVYGVPGRQFGRDFDTVAVGSGPYVIQAFEFGKYITVRRNPDWWARDLPRCRGTHNFDRITARVYLDDVAMKEAFKGGAFDVFMPNSSKDWALDFHGPFVQKNYILRREIQHRRPVGMQGFAFNLRRPLFQSLKTRYALAMVFDFPWSNANLFYNQYTRTRCYFENSPDLTDTAPPAGRLKDYLNDLRRRHGAEAVPKMALNDPLAAPGAGQSAADNLRQAESLLEAAGWRRGADGIRVKGGQRLAFDMLLASDQFLRIIEPYRQRLRELGAEMSVSVLQPAEYEKRERAYEYDMALAVYPHSRSPGNELLGYFSSAAAGLPGGQNLTGLRNPAVDEVLDRVVQARSRADLAFQIHALDRLLTSNVQLVPNWYVNFDRTLLWNKFGLPERLCTQTYFETTVRDFGWADPGRARRLEDARATGVPLPAAR